MAFDASLRDSKEPARSVKNRRQYSARDVSTNEKRPNEILKSLDQSSSNDLCSECRNLLEFFSVQLSLFSYIVYRFGEPSLLVPSHPSIFLSGDGALRRFAEVNSSLN